MKELSKKQSQILRAIKQEDHLTLQHLFTVQNVDPNFDTEDGFPLQIIISTVSSCNMIQMLKLLLDAGADPNGWTNIDGTSIQQPLQRCIVRQSLEGVKLLVRRGANINLGRRAKKWTPLHLAVSCGDYDIIKFLLDSKADVNAEDNHGRTPLLVQLAKTRKDSIELCNLLIEAGADVNLGPSFPLHVAVSTGKINQVLVLLERGANVLSVTGKKEDTALHVACQNGKLDMLEILIRAGIPIESHNRDMFTPLHSAVYHKNILAVMYLLKAGANVNTLNVENCSPIDTAAGNQDVTCLNLLLRAGGRIRGLYNLECMVTPPNQSISRSDYLEYVSSYPMSLRDICILTIRKILAPRLLIKAYLLPLPLVVQKIIALDSLMLDDIPNFS